MNVLESMQVQLGVPPVHLKKHTATIESHRLVLESSEGQQWRMLSELSILGNIHVAPLLLLR